MTAVAETWSLARFSAGARGVFARAQKAADAEKHKQVTLVHMLSALLGLEPVAKVFVEAGADVAGAQAAAAKELARVPRSTDGSLSYLDGGVIGLAKSLESMVVGREIGLSDLAVELVRPATRSIEELDRLGLDGTPLTRVRDAGKLEIAFDTFCRRLPRATSATEDLLLERRRYPDQVRLAKTTGKGWARDVDDALVPPGIAELYAAHDGFVLFGPRQRQVLELASQAQVDVRGATPDVPAHLRLFLAEDRQMRLPIVREDGAWWMLLLDGSVPRARRPFDLRALLAFAFDRQDALFTNAPDEAPWELFFGVS